MTEQAPDDPVDVLRRWQDAGAVWKVLHQQGDRLTIGLFTCDGGEEVSRFTAEDPALAHFVAEEINVDR